MAGEPNLRFVAVVRILVEVATLASVGAWGLENPIGPAGPVATAAGLVIGVALLWGLLAAPKAAHRLEPPARWAFEVASLAWACSRSSTSVGRCPQGCSRSPPPSRSLGPLRPSGTEVHCPTSGGRPSAAGSSFKPPELPLSPTVVPFRSDPLDELAIPDGTHVEEHDLVTAGDVIVGGQSAVEFGVRGRSVVAGERVRFGGHIEAEGDCRLDMWCDVDGDVLVGEDAYLGERVHVGGELKVAGDVNIGDDVDIEEGFEANGWIVIRNPMPTIVFLFVYLGQLLRIGEEEAAEELLAEVFDGEAGECVVVPRGARVGDDAWQVSTPARIGDGCRLHGNLRAVSLTVGRDTEIFGGLRARDGATVGAGTEIAGNVTTRSGTIRIGPDALVRGDVAADHVELHDDAEIEGAIRAREETTIVTEPVLSEPTGPPDGTAADRPDPEREHAELD